ncbi:MAG: DNA-binding protein [Gammaproteobacteria bacterium BRH_c0]|nr:MAG: DNA-binding protein [Gammaproteobacteria bacterium BRH_c0]
MTNQGQTFQPDWVSPPGDTIIDLMEERDWNQAELAQRLGFSPKHLNQLVKGKVSLTHDAALRLERVLGATARFWLNREAQYREQLARMEAKERYQGWASWLDQLPLAELKKTGVIPDVRITNAAKPDLVEGLLTFFGVASPDDWQTHYGGMQASFRRTRESQSDLGAIASWLRLGEVVAEKMDTPAYNKARFEQAITLIRELTVLPPDQFEPEMRRLCAEAGVKLVLVPAIPRAHVSGVARWLNRHSPLIQISLYGKTNDKFWFTFFHEAAHILLHADGKQAIFLDDPNHATQNSPEEDEANRWAGDTLIPSAYAFELSQLETETQIMVFARQINIHPGIVVGRLQHDQKLGYATHLNRLKAGFRFVGQERP